VRQRQKSGSDCQKRTLQRAREGTRIYVWSAQQGRRQTKRLRTGLYAGNGKVPPHRDAYHGRLGLVGVVCFLTIFRSIPPPQRQSRSDIEAVKSAHIAQPTELVTVTSFSRVAYMASDEKVPPTPREHFAGDRLAP